MRVYIACFSAATRAPAARSAARAVARVRAQRGVQKPAPEKVYRRGGGRRSALFEATAAGLQRATPPISPPRAARGRRASRVPARSNSRTSPKRALGRVPALLRFSREPTATAAPRARCFSRPETRRRRASRFIEPEAERLPLETRCRRRQTPASWSIRVQVRQTYPCKYPCTRPVLVAMPTSSARGPHSPAPATSTTAARKPPGDGTVTLAGYACSTAGDGSNDCARLGVSEAPAGPYAQKQISRRRSVASDARESAPRQ